MALGLTQPLNRNEYQGYLLVGKGGWCVWLTTLPLSCADCQFWEPQPPRALELLYLYLFPSNHYGDCLNTRLEGNSKTSSNVTGVCHIIWQKILVMAAPSIKNSRLAVLASSSSNLG